MLVAGGLGPLSGAELYSFAGPLTLRYLAALPSMSLDDARSDQLEPAVRGREPPCNSVGLTKIGGGSAFIFVNHPAIGVQLSLIDVLTAHEGEVHRARIVWRRRCDRAAKPAPVAIGINVRLSIASSECLYLESRKKAMKRGTTAINLGRDAIAKEFSPRGPGSPQA